MPEEHPGRLDLWVGTHDISKQKAPACPLVKARSTDLFDVIPFGTDPRLRGVKVPMFEMNWLIGAGPGQGKTGAVWPTCGCTSWPARATSRRSPGSVTRYCSGLDDAAIAYAAESARLLRVGTERRAAMFKKLRGTGATQWRRAAGRAGTGFLPDHPPAIGAIALAGGPSTSPGWSPSRSPGSGGSRGHAPL